MKEGMDNKDKINLSPVRRHMWTLTSSSFRSILMR